MESNRDKIVSKCIMHLFSKTVHVRFDRVFYEDQSIDHLFNALHSMGKIHKNNNTDYSSKTEHMEQHYSNIIFMKFAPKIRYSTYVLNMNINSPDSPVSDIFILHLYILNR